MAMTQRKAKSASKTKSGIRKRLTDRDKALRDERIVRRLAAGATNADIAAQEGLSPRRMRELTTDIFARRRIEAPDEFHQFQLARLNEAMLVSYAAMGGGNLKAVDRVIKLVGGSIAFTALRTRS
jgi:DNA-binding CsgD family transcriptional regulator